MKPKVTAPRMAYWWSSLTLAEQDEWISFEETYRELSREARQYRKLREVIYQRARLRYTREVQRNAASKLT